MIAGQAQLLGDVFARALFEQSQSHDRALDPAELGHADPELEDVSRALDQIVCRRVVRARVRVRVVRPGPVMAPAEVPGDVPHHRHHGCDRRSFIVPRRGRPLRGAPTLVLFRHGCEIAQLGLSTRKRLAEMLATAVQ